MRANESILPYLLLLLTVVAGAVDAVSYLALGHVFVANMTGNVVFLGFAAAGAGEISLRATLAAMGAFLVGSVAGGRLAQRSPAMTGGCSASRPSRRSCSSRGRSSSSSPRLENSTTHIASL